MIKFDIITIFPDIFTSYFSESIIKRAQQKKLVKINVHNLRDFTTDKHKTVDDKPYGGGPGMVMKIEPIYRAVQFSKLKVKKAKPSQAYQKSKIILFSPRGKRFDQKMAKRFSKLDRLIMICGRYEGVDERVAKYIADEEISIGDYVLAGGELPAMVIVDAVTRLIPGVIALESLKEESFSLKDFQQAKKTKYEYPQYTRPELFEPRKVWGACPPKFCKVKVWRAPKILLSGDHKKIEEWREKYSRKT